MLSESKEDTHKNPDISETTEAINLKQLPEGAGDPRLPFNVSGPPSQTMLNTLKNDIKEMHLIINCVSLGQFEKSGVCRRHWRPKGQGVAGCLLGEHLQEQEADQVQHLPRPPEVLVGVSGGNLGVEQLSLTSIRPPHSPPCLTRCRGS